MKKFLLCNLVAIIFSNCEVSVKKSNANNYNDDTNMLDFYGYQVIIRDGMKYLVLYAKNNPYSNRALSVVNLTKDSLEVALLKKQLANDKNRKY